MRDKYTNTTVFLTQCRRVLIVIFSSTYNDIAMTTVSSTIPTHGNYHNYHGYVSYFLPIPSKM